MPRNKINQFEMHTRKQISDNLRRMLRVYGLTQTSLSDKTGIPPTTLSGYMAKRSTPSPGNIQKIADAIGVDKSDIDPRFKNSTTSANINTISATSIPLIGTIACGNPITAEQNVEQYIPAPSNSVPFGTNFYLKCKGNSMNPTIKDGSLVLIHEQPVVEDGEIAAVLIDSEATLKRVKHQGDTVILLPDNNKFDPIILNDSVQAKILGKAVQVVNYL